MYSSLLNSPPMNKKQVIIMILKVIIYVCTLVLSFLGASAMVSCASNHALVRHDAVITINDTIYIRNGYK